jgi:hypothetical protein
MIAFRDVLIFAGLAVLAAAVIASLFPAEEGASPAPACSDCAFKLTGGYWIRQYGNYAALYLGAREAARYGWAYRADGRPLSIGENATCGTAMYLWVFGGVAYVSCDGTPPRIGRDVLSNASEPKLPLVYVYVNTDLKCTSYTIYFDGDLAEHYAATVAVYDEEGRLVASRVSTIPGSVSFSIPMAGVYRVHIYAPPLLDEWHPLTAQIRISDLVRAQAFTSDNTQDLRPSTSLKIFDLTNYWKKGYRSVTVRVNPAGASFTLSAPTGAFADFLLAWEEGSSGWTYEPSLYRKEVWRLTFTQTDIVLTRVYSWGWRWHEVYVDYRYSINQPGTKTLIWTWNKEGPKYSSYTVPWFSTTVWIESQDSAMNARATFEKVCSWD